MTLFERCASAGRDAYGVSCGEIWKPWAQADPKKRAEWEAITRAVLQTLLDGTGSLRTQEEVSRVLAEVGE